jgi:predicted dienelactone hydrolase
MLVAAPDHKDNRCGADRPPESLPPELLDPNNWSATFYDNRRDDLGKLRAALQADEKFSPQIDTKRVALVGHSLGGYTVLGLAGAWPSWKMDEVTAVVALAPFAYPFLNGGTLEKVSAPVLFESGTADLAITEALEHQGIFAKTAAPACKVVYHGADHFAWTNLRTDFQDATAAAAAAFLDEAFAKRRPTAAILASPQTARAECK